MKKNFYSQLLFLSILLSFFTGCSEDDDFMIATPALTENQSYQDSVSVGSSIVLAPSLKDSNNVDYRWSIDGEVVGTQSTFSFSPDTRGDHEIVVEISNQIGTTSLSYNIYGFGAYEKGFFIINEGWFGRGTGTVSFYDYQTQSVRDSVFLKANPDKNLEPVSAALDFGTIFNENLYLVTKAGGPVVVADAYSLTEEARIAAQPGNDWRAFAGLSETKGVLSAADGLYELNLTTLEINNKIPGVSGQIGDILVSGNYLFALSQTEGIIILDTASWQAVKTIPAMALGFATTEDGTVWAAGEEKLVAISPDNLEVEEIDLNFPAYGSWGAWHPGSITAGDDQVFLAKNGSWSGGNEIYRYQDGDETSLASPFITLPQGKVIYGAGIGYNADKDQLIVNAIDEGWGESYSNNELIIYDAQTGEKQKSVVYSGYYFPAVNVFH